MAHFCSTTPFRLSQIYTAVKEVCCYYYRHQQELAARDEELERVRAALEGDMKRALAEKDTQMDELRASASQELDQASVQSLVLRFKISIVSSVQD